MKIRQVFLLPILALLFTACGGSDDNTSAINYKTVEFTAATFSQTELSNILADLSDNTILKFGEGTYNFTKTFSITGKKNIVIQGAGRTKTIFNFKNSTVAANGVYVSASENIVLCSFTVRDTQGAGNGVEVRSINKLRISNVGTEWSTISSNNGIYGIYPVSSTDVIVENCYAYGARDAGIYSGQSQRVILRDNTMVSNVMGMEVENNIDALVSGNTFTDNTSALLVYDLAGLTLVNGSNYKVINNTIDGNNRLNFNQPTGGFAANAPPGTGIILASTKGIEITGNTFKNQKGLCVLGVSYYMVDPTFNPTAQPAFTPYLEDVNIYANTYSNCGTGFNDATYMADLTDRSNGKLVAGISDAQKSAVTPFARYFFEDQSVYPYGDVPAGNKPVIVDTGGSMLYMNLYAMAVAAFVGNKDPDPRDAVLVSSNLPSFAFSNGYKATSFTVSEASTCP